MNKKTLKFFAGKMALSLSAVVLIFIACLVAADTSEKTAVLEVVAVPQEIPENNFGNFNPFFKLDLKARAVYVYDVKNNSVMFSRNSAERLPLASITKIMTAYTAYKLLPANFQISILNDGFASTTAADSVLKNGERWNLGNLLSYTLVGSSNAGAFSVANTASVFLANGQNTEKMAAGSEKIFVDKMNEEAWKLGLKSMEFKNETGLDVDARTNGGYGSAKDIALFVSYVLKKYPNLLKETALPEIQTASADNHVYKIENTNVLAGEIPGLLASKTGYTNVAGGNVVIAFEPAPGRIIVVSVLGSTAEGRFEDISALVKTVKEKISSERL